VFFWRSGAINGHRYKEVIVVKILASAILIAAFLSGSAKGADQIVPVSVPTFEYEWMSCQQLLSARAGNLDIVNTLSISQVRASSNDTVGVLLTGLPLASMTGGNKEAELAVAKGRDLSIVSLLGAKHC
jgi:hypothetical protein